MLRAKFPHVVQDHVANKERALIIFAAKKQSTSVNLFPEIATAPPSDKENLEIKDGAVHKSSLSRRKINTTVIISSPESF